MKTFGQTLKSVCLASVAAIAVSFAAQTASASSCKFGVEADFTALADVWTSLDCVGEIAGNDAIGNDSGSNVDLNNPANFGGSPLFGETNWTQNTKINVTGGEGAPFSLLPASPAGILSATLASDALSGTWSVSSWAGIGKAALVLKGGNGFAAYLLDLTAGTNGEWVTQALTVGRNNNQPALSHISLYTVPTVPVPVPAAGILLITALGGLGFAARRRKAA